MTHTEFATVSAWCDRPNVDVLAGWEKGIGPLQREGRKLFDHTPPSHLTGQRYADWTRGYEAGKRYRQAYLVKVVHFVGQDKTGKQVVLRFKGWSVKRGTIIARLEKQGCSGDVNVYYFQGSELKRTVRRGI